MLGHARKMSPARWYVTQRDVGKCTEPQSEWNSITGTQEGPISCKNKYCPTDNQDRVVIAD